MKVKTSPVKEEKHETNKKKPFIPGLKLPIRNDRNDRV